MDNKKTKENASVKITECVQIIESTMNDQILHSFAIGDRVAFVYGGLVCLEARVVAVKGSIIRIKANNDDIKEQLDINADYLIKLFIIGDHVKVIAGIYKGYTGFITKGHDNIIIIYNEFTKNEINI